MAIALLAGVFAWYEFGTNDALSVSQVAARGDSPESHWVQVRGRVEANSIAPNATSQGTRFILSDGQERLPVAYQGTLPNSFKPGAEVVVEGNHQSGSLEAYGFVTKSLCNLCHA